MAETTFYVYKLSKGGEDYVGYGITKDIESRHYQHQRTFEKEGVEAKLVFVKVCKSRKAAIKLETNLKAKFRGLGSDITGFKTESLPKELSKSFAESIKSFDFDEDLCDSETKTTSVQTKHVRLKRLNLTNTDLTDKQTEAAFGYTFADPMERFKLFQQLIELRMLLAKHGINDKKDLEASLRSSD